MKASNCRVGLANTRTRLAASSDAGVVPGMNKRLQGSASPFESRTSRPMVDGVKGKLSSGVAALVIVLSLAAPGGATAAMESVQLSKHVCKTTGGGKFVDIPGFPGEKIDRRLLRDVRWMKRQYDVFITDGYATSGHSPYGEHPLGLATDIVPGRGGSWGKIDRLAHKAEPSQNQPRLPWRWVGYDGDSGHGRGHHLHLSWAHSKNTTFGKPARWVLTRKCPRQPDQPDGSGSGDSGGVEARSSADQLAGLAPVFAEPR